MFLKNPYVSYHFSGSIKGIVFAKGGLIFFDMLYLGEYFSNHHKTAYVETSCMHQFFNARVN